MGDQTATASMSETDVPARVHRDPPRLGMSASEREVRAAVEAAYPRGVGPGRRDRDPADRGDRDLAEDCAQEAFAAALTAWPRAGVPCRPGAWLTTTARNRATDQVRRDAAGAVKLRQLAALYLVFSEGYGEQDQPAP